jgi:nucleoside-diphosphate-sugar epimerase
MRIAITGATGFLGRRVTALALDAGHEVRALVRQESKVPAAWREHVRLVRGGLADLDGESSRLLEQADVLIHLAAAGVVRRSRCWSECHDVNVVAAVRWIRRATELRVGRVVAGGTCFEYQGHGSLPEQPWSGSDSAPLCGEDAALQWHDPYGASKTAGGVLMCGVAREVGLPLWYLRFSALFGDDDEPERLIPSALRAALGRKPFEMSGGEQVREILHVEDAARAVLACASVDPQDCVTVVNVGTGIGLTLRAVVGRLFDLVEAPQDLIRTGALPYRPHEPHHLVMRIDALREAVHWSPALRFEDPGAVRTLLPAAR